MNTTDNSSAMNAMCAIQANTQATARLRECLRVAASTFFTGVFGLLSTWMLLTESPDTVQAHAAPMSATSTYSTGDTSVPAAQFATDTTAETQAPTF